MLKKLGQIAGYERYCISNSSLPWNKISEILLRQHFKFDDDDFLVLTAQTSDLWHQRKLSSQYLISVIVATSVLVKLMNLGLNLQCLHSMHCQTVLTSKCTL